MHLQAVKSLCTCGILLYGLVPGVSWLGSKIQGVPPFPNQPALCASFSRPCLSTPQWSIARSGIGRRSLKGVRSSLPAIPAMRTQDLWRALKRKWREGKFWCQRHVSRKCLPNFGVSAIRGLLLWASQLGSNESDSWFQNVSMCFNYFEFSISRTDFPPTSGYTVNNNPQKR